MDKTIAKAWNSELESGSCRVDIMGKGHGNDLSSCANQSLDDFTLAPYCKVEKARDLEAQRDETQWLPEMLEHFWRNGIGSKGFAFLRKTNFITSYRLVTPCLHLLYCNNAMLILSPQNFERGNLLRRSVPVWKNSLWLRDRQRMAHPLPALSYSSKPSCQHMCHSSWLAVWGKYGSWIDRWNLCDLSYSNSSGCLDFS